MKKRGKRYFVLNIILIILLIIAVCIILLNLFQYNNLIEKLNGELKSRGIWFFLTGSDECGDGVCDAYENCLNCSADCGACVYPAFSFSYDFSGAFYIGIIKTNGSAWLEINNTNISAILSSTNVYTAYVNLPPGTYSYKWCAYGNGKLELIGCSSDGTYIVNPPDTPVDNPHSSGGSGGSSGSGSSPVVNKSKSVIVENPSTGKINLNESSNVEEIVKILTEPIKSKDVSVSGKVLYASSLFVVVLIIIIVIIALAIIIRKRAN